MSGAGVKIRRQEPLMMTMRGILGTVAAAVSLVGAGAWRADACTCISPGPPCQAFWKAEAVFDATVERIEPTTRQQDVGDNHVMTLRENRVHLRVSQSWKGPAPGPLDVITAADPGGGMCGYDFKPGRRYLVFAYKHPATGEWSTSICSATREYDGTGETAAFLASLTQPAKGGRIFGSVKALVPSFATEPSSPTHPLEARLRLVGEGRERVIASTGGRFEFTGLAAATYRLELQPPEGYSAREPGQSIEVPDARACVQADYNLQPAGRIVGRVLEADGRPAGRMTTIEVTTPEARAHPTYGLPKVSGYTQENGDLEITGLPPGRYIVGVNLSDLPSKYRPHARTLYPSEGGEPTIVTLGVGQTYDLGTWKLPPPLEIVNVAGTVVWQDGSPAAGIYVGAWDRTGNPVETARGAGGATAGADGRFVIELRRGRVYTFTARGKDSGAALPVEAPRIETGGGPPPPIRIVIRRGPQ
jgi:hypothetical protein